MRHTTSRKLLLLRLRNLSIAGGILILPILMAASRKHVSETRMTNTDSPFHASGDLSDGTICFVRNNWIYLANLATRKQTKLFEGASPRLAPTGKSLVFISVSENEGVMNQLFPPPGRLKVVKLHTMETREFPSLRESRVGNPIWSSDGIRIAVSLLEKDEKAPSIAVLNTITGKLEKKITNGWDPLTKDESIYLDSWAPGGQNVLFHTLHDLYEVNIESGVVEKLSAGELFKLGAISSATQFSFSPNRRYLLFDRMIDTADEPQTQLISIFDVEAKTLRRVTPKNFQGKAPFWLNNDILFTKIEYVRDRWQFSICKIGVDGTGLTSLVEDADSGSYAAN